MHVGMCLMHRTYNATLILALCVLFLVVASSSAVDLLGKTSLFFRATYMCAFASIDFSKFSRMCSLLTHFQIVQCHIRYFHVRVYNNRAA